MTSKLHTKRIYMKNNEAHNRLELINGMIYILLAYMSLFFSNLFDCNNCSN